MEHRHSSRSMVGLEPGDHLCCLYGSEEEHRTVLTPFLRQGLERREKVIYIADSHSAEVVLGYLRDDGVEVERYLATGQFGILEAKDAYLRDGSFDPDRMIALLRSETERALSEGYSALRATGEMTWALRGQPGSERLMEYESKLNVFFPANKCLAICQYDRRRFDPSVLLDVLATHPTALVGTEMHDNVYYMPPEEFLGAHRSEAMLRRWLENLASHKRSREELSRFQSIVTSSEDAIIAVTPRGTVIGWNPGAERLYGYTAEEVVGKPRLILVPPEQPDELPAILERLQRGEHVHHFETTRIRKDGRRIDVSLTVSPIRDADGVIAGFSTIARDISERKRADEALRQTNARVVAILESISDAFFALDDNLVVTYFNRAAELLLGREAEDVVGRQLFEAFPEAKGSIFEQQYRRAIKEKIALSFESYFDPEPYRNWYDVRVFPQEKGISVYFQATTERKRIEEERERLLQLVRSQNEELQAQNEELQSQSEELQSQSEELRAQNEEINKLNRDLEQRVFQRTIELESANQQLQSEIGERKRMQIDLQQSHELLEQRVKERTAELERSNAELQQFAYVASHDLQEPLRMVASYVGLLAQRYKGQLDADADEFIAFAVDGATRMQTLISDLLAYSRVGMRGQPLEPTRSGAALDRALTNLQVAVTENRAVVTNDPLPTVLADASQLVQVFQNLIGNALKFHGPEPSRVHVSAERIGDEWLFAVRDNGIGIAAEYQERIFILFQRLHGRANYPGTGIGLAICKKIVERHGGRIWVSSQPGQGSTFCFTLPVTGEDQW